MKNIIKIIAVAAITLPVLGCNEANNNSGPRQNSSQNSASSQSNAGEYSRVQGAPKPIVGSGRTRDSTRERHKRQAAKYNWYGKYIGGDGEGSSLAAAPEVSPTMTYGTGASRNTG